MIPTITAFERSPDRGRGLARDMRVLWALEEADQSGDLLMVTVLRRLNGSGLLETHPNLCAYIARGEARPAYKRAFDDQMAVFTGT